MNVFLKLRALFTSQFDMVLMLLLLSSIVTRLSVTYFDQSRVIRIPEHSFSSPLVGRDLTAYTILPVYEIRAGTQPYIFGYGSVTLADILIYPLEFFHVCESGVPASCDRLLYIALCLGSFVGFAVLIRYMVQDAVKRMLAYLIYSNILLGVPYAKAIEAGNLDALLAVVYGVVLYGVIRSRSLILPIHHSILLGIAIGLLLSTKAFFILFVGIVLCLRFRDLYLYGACIISFAFTALWPRIYGVPSGIFDVFTFAMRGSDAFGPQLYTQINYGNNAILSYVSNVLQMFWSTGMTLPLHTALTQIGTVCVGYMLFIQPLVAEGIIGILGQRTKKSIRLKNLGIYTESFAMVLFTYTTVGMISIPAWSYDYRLLYLFPVIILLLQRATTHRTKELLYWAILLLMLKSLWIPKDRLLTVFLYAHMYLLIRASISLWKESYKTALTQ